MRIMVLAGLVGCSGRIQELAEEPVAGEGIVAVFPPHGTMRLLGDVPVQIVLGSAAEGQALEVSVTRDEGTSILPCLLSPGGVVAECGFLNGVEAGEEVDLAVSVGDEAVGIETVGRVPDPGLGWSLLDGAAFTAIGDGSAAVSLANKYISDGNAFAAIDGYDGTPGSWKMVGGPSGLDVTDGIGLVPPGLAFLVTIEVEEDGSFYGTSDTAWLPVYVRTDMVHLLLLDVVVSGKLDGPRLTNLLLTADAPALALEALTAPLGAIGSELLGVISLDVDRDGDGAPDAASIRLEGEPAPAELVSWLE